MFRYQKLHWMVVNALVRVFGVGATLIGVAMVVHGAYLLLHRNATVDVNGVPSSDPWEKGIVFVVGLVAILIGMLVLMARPYRPDLGDRPFSFLKKH